MEDFTNIFYDREIDEPISIIFDNNHITIAASGGAFSVSRGSGDSQQEIGSYNIDGSYNGGVLWEDLAAFKFYRFMGTMGFGARLIPRSLFPPYGENLVEVLLTHNELRKQVGVLFQKSGLKLVINPMESKLELQKEQTGLVSFPYSTVSETLRRLVFYLSAIRTAQNSVIILEEPEAHAFPFYTRYLGELIAADKSNQYFIATHNPYFLLGVIEKAKKEDTATYLTYYEDYRTKLMPLKHEDILELETDVFFNIDKLLKGLPRVVS